MFKEKFPQGNILEVKKEEPRPEKEARHIETREMINGEYNFLEVKPEVEKSEVPVFFAPGLAGHPEPLRLAMNVLADEGKRSLTMAQSDSFEEKEIEETENPLFDGFHINQIKKAKAVLEVLEAREEELVDMVAYSEAGIYGLIAASMDPEKFRNIVLLNPAGMIGKESSARMILRIMKSKPVEWADVYAKSLIAEKVFGRKRYNRENLALQKRKMYEYFKKHSQLDDINAMSESDVYDLVECVVERGVSVSVMSDAGDCYFPSAKMQERSTAPTSSGKKISDLVDGFVVTSGDHKSINLEPEKYAKAINGLIDSMVKKEEKAKKID